MAGKVINRRVFTETQTYTEFVNNRKLSTPLVTTLTTTSIQFDCDWNGDLLTYSTADSLYSSIRLNSGVDWRASNYGIRRTGLRYAIKETPEGDQKLESWWYTGLYGSVEMREVRPGIWRVFVQDESVEMSLPPWVETPETT